MKSGTIRARNIEYSSRMSRDVRFCERLAVTFRGATLPGDIVLSAVFSKHSVAQIQGRYFTEEKVMEVSRTLFIPVILGTARLGRMSQHAAELVTGELGKCEGVATELIDIASGCFDCTRCFCRCWSSPSSAPPVPTSRPLIARV